MKGNFMMTISNIMLERRSLINAFNELRHHQVIAVCAPAGYGKTVAVTQWLDNDLRAKAVISLDEYDNNLPGFCERFCAALCACQPLNQTLNDIVYHHYFQSAPEEFALRAVAALASRRQTVLTIDDLHLIHNNDVLKLLHVFIKRLPKNFQVVLISRNDLPSGLSEFCVKGQAARINIEQLLFNDDEIMALYKKRGNQITQEQANVISQQTNGWAIGINAFVLSGGKSLDKAYDYLDDFVRSNIWDKWDDTTRDFMLCTTFLRELTPSLCEVMTGIPHSDRFLKELAQRGAFITQAQEGVYRYHNLFQQLLSRIAQERGEEFIFSLLEKEGYWHLSQMDYLSAFDCFIRCRNHEGIEKCYYLLDMHGHKSIVVERLLPILKHEEFHKAAYKYPRLLFLLAFCALVEGRKDDVALFMDEYYAKHSEIADTYPNLAHQIHYLRDLDFRIPLNQIINEMKVPDDTSNVTITLWRASTYLPLLHRAIVEVSDLAIGDVIDNVKSVLAPKTSWLYGDVSYVNQETLIAGLMYEQGYLHKAYEHALIANAQMHNQVFYETKFWSMMILVNILDGLDEKNEASEVQQSIIRMIEEERAYHLYYNFNAFSARRNIEAGRFRAAEDWLSTNTFDTPFFWQIYTALTTCRAYINTSKYDSAIILLNKILEIASAFNRPLDIMEARILLAIACWKKKRGFQKDAIKHLESAVLAACPYGYVQMFINDGAELAGLLKKLQNIVAQRNTEDKEHLSFIKLLYLKTCNIKNTNVKSQSDEKPLKFTDKQKKVMGLLCKGKSYKEIADAINIKQSSLRNHLALIYKKLGVANMVDAIHKINELGLV